MPLGLVILYMIYWQYNNQSRKETGDICIKQKCGTITLKVFKKKKKRKYGIYVKKLSEHRRWACDTVAPFVDTGEVKRSARRQRFTDAELDIDLRTLC